MTMLVLLLVLLGLVSGLHETTQRRKNSDYDVLLSTFSSGPSGNLSLSLHVDVDPSFNPNVDPNFLWFTLVVLNNDQRVCDHRLSCVVSSRLTHHTPTHAITSTEQLHVDGIVLSDGLLQDGIP